MLFCIMLEDDAFENIRKEGEERRALGIKIIQITLMYFPLLEAVDCLCIS